MIVWCMLAWNKLTEQRPSGNVSFEIGFVNMLSHLIQMINCGSVGVWEEERTRNYIKLVLAPQMGRGITPNTVGEN